jgi:hypothetical protein
VADIDLETALVGEHLMQKMGLKNTVTKGLFQNPLIYVIDRMILQDRFGES